MALLKSYLSYRLRLLINQSIFIELPKLKTARLILKNFSIPPVLFFLVILDALTWVLPSSLFILFILLLYVLSRSSDSSMLLTLTVYYFLSCFDVNTCYIEATISKVSSRMASNPISILLRLNYFSSVFQSNF
jgi:hypothetical protein